MFAHYKENELQISQPRGPSYSLHTFYISKLNSVLVPQTKLSSPISHAHCPLLIVN